MRGGELDVVPEGLGVPAVEVEELGEDMWLFASDWPHGDTGWPEAVQQTVDRPRLTDSARRKILGENAARLYGIDIAAQKTKIANAGGYAHLSAAVHKPA